MRHLNKQIDKHNKSAKNRSPGGKCRECETKERQLKELNDKFLEERAEHRHAQRDHEAVRV